MLPAPVEESDDGISAIVKGTGREFLSPQPLIDLLVGHIGELARKGFGELVDVMLDRLECALADPIPAFLDVEVACFLNGLLIGLAGRVDLEEANGIGGLTIRRSKLRYSDYDCTSRTRGVSDQ
jgi:hypothetical protein